MNDAIKKLSEAIANEVSEALTTEETQKAIERTKAASDSGTFEVIISSNSVDRSGEVIDQSGMSIERFMQNPVVLFGHDHFSLPIGVADEIVQQDSKTIARGRFAPEEANPFAQQVRHLYDAGIVRATSVGVIVHETEGNIITKSELIEFSFVNVPANPDALSLERAKSLGLNVEMLAIKGLLAKAEEAETKENNEDENNEENTQVVDEVEEVEKGDDDSAGDEVSAEGGQDDSEAPENDCENGETEKSVATKALTEQVGAETTILVNSINDLLVKYSTKVQDILGNTTEEVKEAPADEVTNEVIEQDDTASNASGEPVTADEKSKDATDVDTYLMSRRLLREVAFATNKALKEFNQINPKKDGRKNT